MPEATAEPTPQAAPPAEQSNSESIDWVAESRKWEQRAKTNKAEADKNREAAARLSQLEEANKSETEKLLDRATKAEERASTAEGRYAQLLKRQAITEAASSARAIDVETVYLHLNARGGIDIDSDGNVTGLDKALSSLQKDKPHLFNTTPPGARDAAAGGGSTPPALNSTALEDAVRAAVGAI